MEIGVGYAMPVYGERGGGPKADGGETMRLRREGQDKGQGWLGERENLYMPYLQTCLTCKHL